MTRIEEYQLYQRCEQCGQILTQWEIDYNNGCCNYCHDNENAWIEFPVGCRLNTEINNDENEI